MTTAHRGTAARRVEGSGTAGLGLGARPTAKQEPVTWSGADDDAALRSWGFDPDESLWLVEPASRASRLGCAGVVAGCAMFAAFVLVLAWAAALVLALVWP